MSALVTLLDVQGHDTKLDQLKHRRATLPQKAELADLERRRAEVLAQRSAVASQRDDVAGRQAKAEDEVAATETRITEIDKRMVSGVVTASRDLQAMQAEIDSLRARVSNLEDAALEAMEEREPLDGEVGRLDDEIVTIDERMMTLRQEIESEEAQIEADVRAEQQQRDDVAQHVPADLMTIYERLRSRLAGVGAARLDGNRCAGCHLTLPATELDRIKHQDQDVLVYCEQCGRILVRTD